MTTWIAVYGALVSSATIGWNVWRHFRETGRLRSTFEWNYGSARREPYFNVRIANGGTRPITAVAVLARDKKAHCRALVELRKYRAILCKFAGGGEGLDARREPEAAAETTPPSPVTAAH